LKKYFFSKLASKYTSEYLVQSVRVQVLTGLGQGKKIIISITSAT